MCRPGTAAAVESSSCCCERTRDAASAPTPGRTSLRTAQQSTSTNSVRSVVALIRTASGMCIYFTIRLSDINIRITEFDFEPSFWPASLGSIPAGAHRSHWWRHERHPTAPSLLSERKSRTQYQGLLLCQVSSHSDQGFSFPRANVPTHIHRDKVIAIPALP